MGDEYYEEEGYEEDTGAAEGEEGEVDWDQHVQDKKDEITEMLNNSQVMDALKCSLDEAPVGDAGKEAKNAHVETVMMVIGAIKDADIERFVKNLEPTQIDLLMQYVYRGMEVSDNHSSLLKWHGKVFDKGGMGSIVRTLLYSGGGDEQSPDASTSTEVSSGQKAKSPSGSPGASKNSPTKASPQKSRTRSGTDETDSGQTVLKPSMIAKKNIKVDWMVSTEKKRSSGAGKWAGRGKPDERGTGGGTKKKLRTVDDVHPIGKIFGLQSTTTSGKKPKIILPPDGAYC